MEVTENIADLRQWRGKIKLLAVDLDGTLLNDNKEISVRNIEILKAAMSKGIRLCITTGRAWPGSKRYAEVLKPNAVVINSNGAMMTEPATEKILFDKILQKEDAKKIFALGQERNISQIIWSQNILYGNRIDERLEDYGRRFAMMKPRLADDIDELLNHDISKILWYDTAELTQRWQREIQQDDFKQTTICTSTPLFIEFYNSSVSKAKTLEKAAGLYGINMNEVLAIGDGGNDIPMLEAAGVSVAMGNASREVKEKSAFITLDNEHDGVAAAVEAILP